MKRAFIALAALCLPLSCATPKSAAAPRAVEAAAPAPVRRFPAFPERLVSGNVEIEAAFLLDHAAVFGGDLPTDADVLPVSLSLLSSAAAPTVPLESMRLVLPDGSQLNALDPARIRTTLDKVSTRARAHALGAQPGALLGESFVYFALVPRGDLHLNGSELRRRTGIFVRSLDLSRSLIVFELHGDGPPRRVSVGVGLAERK